MFLISRRLAESHKYRKITKSEWRHFSCRCLVISAVLLVKSKLNRKPTRGIGRLVSPNLSHQETSLI